MTVKKDEIELKQMWEADGGYIVSKNADRIVLIADGRGPMGWYDRIHVHQGDKHFIFPAHNVQGWEEVQCRDQ